MQTGIWRRVAKKHGPIILESMLTITADIHNAVMALLPEERRDREKVNAAVRDGLSPGPLRAPAAPDEHGVPKAEECGAPQRKKTPADPVCRARRSGCRLENFTVLTNS
jgi:hypothetical protein